MEAVQNELIALSEENYQNYHAGLLPGIEHILGVRVPKLRILAKRIAKGDWRDFLGENVLKYYEEYMLKGMVIGYAKKELSERLEAIVLFVPRINNWAIGDNFCSGLKFNRQDKETMWIFLQPYFIEEGECSVRFAVVATPDFYVEASYIERIFPIFDRIRHNGYYVKMAVAWALSVCYIRFPKVTLNNLYQNTLDDFTYNKALQKISESSRVNVANKTIFRSKRRKYSWKSEML